MIEIGPAKSRFIAKSSMTFAQFIGTAGLATRLFGDFSLAWKAGLAATMLILISLAVVIFPNKDNGEEA